MGFNARSVSYELLIPVLVTARPLAVSSVTMCPSGLRHLAAVGCGRLLAAPGAVPRCGSGFPDPAGAEQGAVSRGVTIHGNPEARVVALLVDGAGRPSGCRRGVCFYKIQIGTGLLGHDQPQLGKENSESRHARPVRVLTKPLTRSLGSRSGTQHCNGGMWQRCGHVRKLRGA